MSLSDGQYLTRHRRCTVRLQPLFRFDHDRSGRRQLLNLCSPLDGKPSVADLEDYPLADYVLSSAPLRKLDDALHRMRSSGRRTAIPAWSAFLGCELPHCYRAGILADPILKAPVPLAPVRLFRRPNVERLPAANEALVADVDHR